MRIISITLLVCAWFCSALMFPPVQTIAYAQSRLLIGFVVDDNPTNLSAELVADIIDKIEPRLMRQVRSRSFSSEEQLLKWLNQYKEVDVAWFSSEFFQGVPAGQAYLFRELNGRAPWPQGGVLVSRQGLSEQIHHDIEQALSGFTSDYQKVEVDTHPISVTTPKEKQPFSDSVDPSIETSENTTETISNAVALAADSMKYDAADGSYEAEGAVVLTRDEVKIQSDKILWQSLTQDALASGSVRLEDEATRISADNMQYNLSTERGRLNEAEVFVKENNFHIRGGTIEKLSHADYMIRKGRFTTCEGAIPDWEFTAEEVEVTLGGFAEAKHVLFHIKDVPVFYTPYFSFPVKSERESGFLAPWFGYSDNKGWRVALSWYQVIDYNQDATFYLDYLSEIALGKGVEYRYALPRQNNGKALYYHVSGFNSEPDSFLLEWEHQGRLPGDWKLSSDVEYVNNHSFFEEFGEVAEDYNREFTVSTLLLQRQWQKLSLSILGRYLKDLDEDGEDTAAQKIPEVSLGLSRQRVGTYPVFVGLETYATYFHGPSGEDGGRLYLKPLISSSLSLGPWFYLTPELALHKRVYSADSERNDYFSPEYKLALGSKLYKNYPVNSWGMDSLQHWVEPQVAYNYIPERDHKAALDYDLYDRIGRKNRFEYALVNRVIARSKSVDGLNLYREVFNLRLSQSYNVDDVTYPDMKNRHWSGVNISLDLRPNQTLGLFVDAIVPVPKGERLRKIFMGASAADEHGNALRLNYYRRENSDNFQDIEYAGFGLDTSVLQPFYVRFEERYDLSQNRELERKVGVEYREKCWSLLLTYKKQFQEFGGDDHEIMINFVLAGLDKNRGFGNGFDGLTAP